MFGYTPLVILLLSYCDSSLKFRHTGIEVKLHLVRKVLFMNHFWACLTKPIPFTWLPRCSALRRKPNHLQNLRRLWRQKWWNQGTHRSLPLLLGGRMKKSCRFQYMIWFQHGITPFLDQIKSMCFPWSKLRFRSALKVRPKKYIQYPTRNWPLKDHPELQIKPRWLEVPKLPEFFQRGDFTEMFFKSPSIKVLAVAGQLWCHCLWRWVGTGTHLWRYSAALMVSQDKSSCRARHF